MFFAPNFRNHKIFVLAAVEILLFGVLAAGQDQQLPPGGAAAQPPAADTPKSSSKAAPPASPDAQALLTAPDAKEVAVFKCASFQTPRATGHDSEKYTANCPLEEIYGSDKLISEHATPLTTPSQRLADVLAKYVTQPLKTGEGKDTQLSVALKQLLKYAYNDEAIFPAGPTYAVIHLVDRQGATGEAANAKVSAKTTVAAPAKTKGKQPPPAPAAQDAAATPPADKPDPNAQPDDKSRNSQPVDRWILALRDKKNVITLSEDKRIFGVKSIAVVFIHVNANIDADADPGDQFGDVSYRAITKSRLPQNISDLLGLLQVSVGLFNIASKETRVAYIGFGMLTTVPVPSDVTVFGVESGVGSQPGQKGLHLIGQSAQYDDEGKYWWDASVGVPINKLSLVQYSQDNQTFTPKTINKQSVYGMINLFVHPVDLKHVEYIPHPVVGIGLTGRPGENFMYGIAWGVPQLQVFFGRAYATHVVPQGGGQQHYQHDWTYGINVPVVSAIKQLASKKSATTTPPAAASKPAGGAAQQ